MEAVGTEIGAAIRDERNAQGLSIRRLAHLAGTNASYLSHVERGLRIPSDRWLRDITDALGRNLSGAA